MGGLTNSAPDGCIQAVSLAVTMDRIKLYADITDDYNPIHVDPEFAATTPMGGVIAHGTMSLALIWQSLRRSFEANCLAAAELNVRFVKPVRVDDELTACGKEADEADQFDVWVRNQYGQDVIVGKVVL